MAKDGSWHKGVLIPFWVFELALVLASIGICAYNIYYATRTRYYSSYSSYSSYYNSYYYSYRYLAGSAMVLTWSVLYCIFDMLQIIFFARHTLGPVLVISTSALTLGLYLVSAVSIVASVYAGFIIFIFTCVLAALSFGKMIYSIVIYRRRKSTNYDPSRAFNTAPAGSYAQQPAATTGPNAA